MHIKSTPIDGQKDTHNRIFGIPTAKPHHGDDGSIAENLFTYGRPAGLPHEFDTYLTTTSRPHEIFVSLRDSRDQRLRLLLRRFTNQILYGCKNSQCNVSTCLSYRKRRATTPVRPYTEVAARALAWRCVEEYANSSSDQGQVDGFISRKKGRPRQEATDTRSRLCWNEPVVPWYETPASAQRRGSSIHSRRGTTAPTSVETRSVNGQCSPKSDGVYATHGSSQSTTEQHANPPPIDEKEVPLNETRPRNDHLDKARHKSSEGIRTGHFKEQFGREGANEQRCVSFAEPPHDHIDQILGQTKDTSSFAQTLYDTTSIKALDVIQPRYKSAQPGQTEHCTDASTLDMNSPYKINNYMYPVHSVTGTLPRILTFKVLPLSAIIWFQCATNNSQCRVGQPKRDIPYEDEPLTHFARQSLHYCLSRPARLLESAQTWQYLEQRPTSMKDQNYRSTLESLWKREKQLLNLTSDIQLPQSSGIFVAFATLIAMTSVPEVLGHLFAALQHAYVLPPWLEHAQRKDNISLTRISFDGAGSRLLPTDSAHTIERQPTFNAHPEVGFLDDDCVAKLCILTTWALYCTIDHDFNHSLTHPEDKRAAVVGEQFHFGRSSGTVFPQAMLKAAWADDPEATWRYHTYAALLDSRDDWACLRLFDSIADVISHRLAIAKTANVTKRVAEGSGRSENILSMIISQIVRAMKQKPYELSLVRSLQKTILDLARSVLLRCWDREARVKRRGPVGGVLELLAAMYRSKTELYLSPIDFIWKFVADSFDEIEMPMKWTQFREDNTQTHILAYSFLFEPAVLVRYFRAINSIAMRNAHESASAVFANARQFLHTIPVTVYGAKEVLAEMRPHMARFFVLTIRRQYVLQDAIDQIWRRQRRELMRPLKVRLGKDEGEDGLDHGGVQQEFFRVVFAEALDPNYGMFATDERTRMTWFRPGSFEPLFKFEALGILMSLAIYNGLTLPVTFPLALYRKLLGLKVKSLDHIDDGWPDLTKGLRQLLEWADGDVGEVIARTYEFSYEAFGAALSVDMTRVGRDDPWPPVKHRKNKEKAKTASFDFPPTFNPTPPDEEEDAMVKSSSTQLYATPLSPQDMTGASPPPSLSASTPPSPKSSLITASIDVDLESTLEAPLVTNANRHRYVKDYIHWLTTKSISSQFTSFATGFYTCLDRTALSMFTPEHLKIVVEGHQTIDIDGLQSTTTYEDYNTDDPVVEWFWQVVRDMSPTQHKQLLEFVTASDRVPVNGIGSVVFIVQRNGDGDERLPSSSTCYGRLLLPRYTTKDVLRIKLEKAIENSVGFGSL